MYSQKTSHGNLFFLGLVVLCFNLLSCISIQMEGQSSFEMKRSLEDSYLLKSMDRFYPDGVPQDLSQVYPHLGHDEEKAMKEELDGLITALHRAHEEKYPFINAVIPELTKSLSKQFLGSATIAALLKQFSSNLKLTNHNSITAFTNREGHITLDIRVLQALFRGALLENFRENPENPMNPLGLTFGSFMMSSKEFDPTFEPSNATKEQREAIMHLYQTVQTIKETEGNFLVGDMMDAFSDNSKSNWGIMASISQRANILQAQYLGAVLFLLAHEHGHLALNHYSRLQDLKSQSFEDERKFQDSFCLWRGYFEMEADVYALLILSPYTGKKAVFPMMDLQGVGQHRTGYRNFFQYGYSLSGFEETPGEICSYPTKQQRYNFVEELNDALVKKSNERMFNDMPSGKIKSSDQ